MAVKWSVTSEYGSYWPEKGRFRAVLSPIVALLGQKSLKTFQKETYGKINSEFLRLDMLFDGKRVEI